MPSFNSKLARNVTIGLIGVFWCVLAVWLAGHFASTGDENKGKLVGTVMSAVAFIPPAVYFQRRYERQRLKEQAERRALAAEVRAKVGAEEE